MNDATARRCPFCGAQAFGPYVAHGDIPVDHYLNHYQVACSDQFGCGAVVTGGSLKTEVDAVKHWNRPHQAVAAALAELRAHALRLPTADYSTDGDGAELIKQDAVLKLIDATIAKLDLPEAAPASCTWTLDDDGNYATGCDGLFVVLKDSLAGYQMASCCFCGRPIKEQQ